MREVGAGAGAILTVTPNPSLDLLYTTGRLVRDDANRVAEPRLRPGGQGINVARVVAAFGGDASAVTLLGGASGDEIRRTLAGEGVHLHAATAGGPTRTFVAVFETDTGHSLLLNSPGPERSPAEEEALLALVADRIERLRPAWVAGCGSLPPGFATDFYRRVGRLARAGNARFVPDCDRPALAEAVRDGCDLVVPNRHEAARLTGRPVGSVLEAADVASGLLDTARLAAAITLGHEGAVLATREGVWHAVVEPPLSGTAVGAGDAFLARLLLGLMGTTAPEEALAGAVAAGGAALLSTGPGLADPAASAALRPRVRTTRLGPARRGPP